MSLLPRSTTGRLGLALLFIVAATGGVVAGRTHAWNQSVGGLTAALGGGIVMVGVGIGVVVLALIALTIARLARAGPVSGVQVLVVVIAGFGVGVPIGISTAAATGGTYVEPVTFGSTGTRTAVITSPTADFVPREGGAAECQFDADRALTSVTAVDLGELGPGTLSVMIVIDAAVMNVAHVDLYIDGADTDPDAGPATWAGQGKVDGLTADGTTGSVAFVDVPPNVDEKTPVSKPEWGGALSGSIDWTCGPPS